MELYYMSVFIWLPMIKSCIKVKQLKNCRNSFKSVTSKSKYLLYY